MSKQKTKQPAPLKGGLDTEKPPTPRVRKLRRGVGVLEIPVHVSEGPTRLPNREADYIHPARPDGRPETEQERLIKRMYRDGLTLERICINCGVNPRTVANLLGIPTDTKDFQTTVDNLEARKRV